MEETQSGVFEVVTTSERAASDVSLEALRRFPVVLVVLSRDDGAAWLVQMKLFGDAAPASMRAFANWVVDVVRRREAEDWSEL